MSQINPVINFDKEVFFPGEEITGKIELKISKDQSARKIEIKFLNETVVGWAKGGKPIRSHSSAKASETHLQVVHEVWTADDDQNILPAGEYEWNFSFELPKDCQPTYESPLGYIRYLVSIHVDVPHFADESRERATTVATRLNLNDIANIGDGVKITAQDAKIGCNLFPFLKKGTAEFAINVPKQGYVAGETIHVQGHVENGLKAPIRAIRAALVRKTVTRIGAAEKSAAKNSQVSNSVLFGVVEELVQIPSGTDRDFSFAIAIPSVAPTIRNNALISVEYAVQIAAIAASRCVGTAIGEVPIVIGTVPVGNNDAEGVRYEASARGDLDTACAVDRMTRGGATVFVPKYSVFKNL